MNSLMSLRNQFLIAMPSLVDPHFHQSLTYICEHTPDGAMGLVINRPIELTIDEIFQQMDIQQSPMEQNKQLVLLGGPIQTDRGFILHEGPKKWQSTLAVDVDDDLYLTSSSDILEDIANDKGPDNYLIVIGYAGWGPGQLEQELSENGNAWITCPANKQILFHTPAELRRDAAAATLGINMNLMTTEVGHS